jgi:O-antigen/teichoic acid export membrane protein
MTIGTMAALVASLGFEQAQAKAWSAAQRPRAELLGAALRVAATTGGGAALLVIVLWVAGSAGVFDGLGLLASILIVAALVPLRVLLALVRGLLIVGGRLERSNVALAAGDLARTLAIVALALAGALSVEAAVATFWVATLVALLLLPVLAVAAPLTIHLVFGAAFVGATDALWALLPAAVAMAFWRALSAGLVRFGRPREVNAIALAALAANLVLNLCLIGPLGIAGAALASLGSYGLGAALAAAVFARGRLRARDLLPGAGDLRRLVAFVRAVR